MDEHVSGNDSGRSRRWFLGGSLAGLAASVGPLSPVAAAPASPSGPMQTDEDIDRILPELSNWGRWGHDDQIGTLNFITPETRLRAAALIRSGRTVSLAREISLSETKGLRDVRYEMHRYEDAPPEEAGCVDHVGMIFHGFGVTHLDALCHLFTPSGKDGMYNGFPISDVTADGARNLGVERMGLHGIVGRGVLLDVAAARGGALPPGSTITVSDLEAAETMAGLTVGEGDILFIRNGAGAANTYQLGTGLHAECLPWLHARRVALLSSDSDSDAHPPAAGIKRWTEPVHMIAIPYMGLPLMDNTNLDDLASMCAEERRWEFFLSVAPWRFRGTTSSPVNPLAIF